MERPSQATCLICLDGVAYVRGLSLRGDQRWYTFVCNVCGHSYQGPEHTDSPSPPMVGNEVTLARKPDRRSKIS